MAKSKTGSNLVIIESSGKVKSVAKYLGPEFQVKVSMGHVRDLPKSKLGVDVEHGFAPDYQPIKGKEDVIADLRTSAKKSSKVYLATDPDREGEAIAWHLKNLLELPDEKTCRITFNEITQKAVSEAVEAPRPINQNLVDAQQARRILDRIVGYQLSPLLWKKIRRGLSAGRVQSVVTRIVSEREEEIRAFVPEEYWSLDAHLQRVAPKLGAFKAAFYGREKKMELKNAQEVAEVESAVQNAPFTVQTVKRQDKTRNPSPPFTTSSLQQEASRKLGMTPRRTMSIAQQLYEGVDIEGEGTVGLISYMRTDSLRLSDEALDAAKQFITARYGAQYYPEKTRTYKAKSGAQDAHEAIRPSNVNLTPENLKKDLTSDQYRVYKLIWSRFLACQMASAIYDSVTIDVESAGYVFRANHTAVKFSGYTAVYVEGKDEEEEAAQSPLPDLAVGETLHLDRTEKEQHFTQPPARYTEATLIKVMEEKGIGRPSTYAPTVSTIIDRQYVVKEGKYLRITPLGEVVTGLMKEKFPDIVDSAFTAHMEAELDEVEDGKLQWQNVLDTFYQGFSEEMSRAEADLDGTRIKVPDEVTDEICEVCGKNMVVKSGRFGRFLACPGFPDCTFTKPIVVEMPGRCPRCGGRILKRTSAKGYAYYACEFLSGKTDKKCEFMTWDVPVKEDCPECGQTLFKKSGRGYKKPFCINPACPNFLPEDQRGYKKKEPAEGEAQKAEEQPEGKGAAKETAPAAKKTAAKKPAAKKATAKKTTAKKPTKKAKPDGTAQ
ncbi:MAG: type I DNA topoisomerase [Oscillospiraceae bacterium]|nr:type I DNA topoisomerase [Oscillospiraceae bacterium]